MSAMVQNLLDANRIERGEVQVQLSQAAVGPLLSRVMDIHQPRAQSKGQRLWLEDHLPSISAWLDPDIAIQIFDNLISNAIKYSPPGSEVSVRLVRGEGGVLFELQDEGPGIGPEDQNRLFKKFSRLSAQPTAGEPSTGLGLSIVKKLAEAIHARVECQSQLGQGSTFRVEFRETGVGL
jgi:signal transduction histidine kinase